MEKIKLIRVRVDLTNPNTFPKGFVNKDALDATTKAQIRLQEKVDDEQAKLDALNKNT
jgi:putative transcriptional regulator